MKRILIRHLLSVCLAALMPVVAGAGEGKIRKRPNAVKDEYIVVLRDDLSRADVPGIAQRLTRGKGKLEKVWQDGLKGFFVRMSEGQAFGLSHHPDVAYIEENAEMFLSAEQRTDIDPSTCTQPDSNCQLTNDNRLWHLDRVDQNTADLTKKYGWCDDAAGVTVYVLDTGVLSTHTEFAAGQVVSGYNASGDGNFYPATDPCAGTVQPNRGHGTGVASVVAGRRTGVAKNATIVPVKIMRCGDLTAQALQEHTYYPLGKMVGGGNGRGAIFQTVTAGTTGDNNDYPSQWPLESPVCWGGPDHACFQYVGNAGIVAPQTTQMTIDGINWIVGASNPYKSQNCAGSPPPANCGPVVATFSTFRVVAKETAGDLDTLEGLIRTMISRGITVVASANNQNSNACDTTPGRMSLADPVITVGGTMILNDPDPPGSGNGGVVGLEPVYNPLKGTRDARWRCGPGDSDNCTQNGMASPPPTPLPPDNPGYDNAIAGSNGGQCVTLFAPAKNVTVAEFATSNAYRNRLAAGGGASGTSWSAPLVAGVAARILKANPTMSPQVVRETIVANAAHNVMDTEGLDPPGVTAWSTPNILLRLANVSMAAQPTQQTSGGTTTITAQAQTTSAGSLTYQWYVVNAGFELGTYPRGAHASQMISSASNPSAATPALSVSTPSSATGYWVRVTSDCAVVDSDIVVVDPSAPPAPTNVNAIASGGTVVVTWNASPNADRYHLERKVTGQPWTFVISTPVSGSPPTTLPDTAPPLTDDGVAVYRVRASKGTAYSPYSALDFAHPKAFADAITIKAVDIIELRKAANAMADAAGLALPYAPADLLEPSLKAPGRAVQATDFTDLMSRINSVRTNTAYGRPTFNFSVAPASNNPIVPSHILNLRSAVE